MLATSHRYQRMGSCMQPRNIWPWQPCNYEAKRVILRSVYLEEPLRMAPVCVPSGLSPLKLVERCLGINECLGAAWEALKGQGVFTNGESSEDSCLFCPANQYLKERSDHSGSSCMPCPDNAGTGPGEQGGIDENSCKCNAGFYANTGHHEHLGHSAFHASSGLLVSVRSIPMQTRGGQPRS